MPAACARRSVGDMGRREPLSASPGGAGGDPWERVRAALAQPATYAPPPARVEVAETHISCVFLAGARAYKLKKPLTLAFLDYGSPSRRRAMCEAEVRLNRRLSDDVYVGVRGVVLDPARGGAALTDPDDPDAVEFVVEMRRYAERDTLAAAVNAGPVGAEAMHRIAARIAAFHATAAPAPTGTVQGSTATLSAVTENVGELLRLVSDRRVALRIRSLERFMQSFVSAHRLALDARAARGRVREGHGDLRADHVLIADHIQIVDCVEFDSRLRRLDVADDLAFLVADLAARGAWEPARRLVDGYRAAGGDPGSDELIACYAVHRALVRAKVARLRARQLPARSTGRHTELRRARVLLTTAERLSWQTRQPVVLVICGVPASGKTRVARELRRRAGLLHLSSDAVRKELVGVAPTRPAPAAAYAAAADRATYGALGRRAREAVAARGGVIVDATFRHRADRDVFAAALGPAPVIFVECRAPRAVLLQRAASRHRGPGQPSDAGPAVVARESRRWDPLDETAAAAHLVVRTDRPVEDVIDDIEALLVRRRVV